MPKSCCVPMCTTNRLKNYTLKFYILPNIKTEPERRRKWLEAINRKDESGKLWEPATRHVYVCSRHFSSGLKNEGKNHLDYVPSLFPGDDTSASDELRSPQSPVKMEVLDPNGSGDSDMACKTWNTGSPAPNKSTKRSLEAPDRNRTDTALAALTRRFMDLVKRSQNGILDLNVASLLLNAPKRRIYDVINVLEGISLLKKKSKNFIEWAGSDEILKDNQLMTLALQEERLDYLIHQTRQQLHQVFKDHQSQRFVYLTYEDVKNIPCLKEQTVMVIKAPAETKMEVPHPQKSFQVHLSSTQGPIDVFMCSDDPMPEDCGCLTDGDNPDQPALVSSRAVSQPGCSWKEMLCCLIEEGNKTMLAIIPDSVVLPSFGLSQHNTHRPLTSPPPTAHLPRPTKLVTPSPLLSTEGYLLGLVKDEGITDPAPLDTV